MIYFVVRDVTGRYAMMLFLAAWGKSLAPAMRVIDYDSLFAAQNIRSGSYIFSELDYLNTAAIESAVGCWDAIEQCGGDAQLLNHPRNLLLRYELLRRLYDEGVNNFNVYRLDEDRAQFRYPVFIRGENDHEGPVSDLLTTPEALTAAIFDARARGADTADLLITEFSDCRGVDGLYRKYGAFNVAGQIIPRHLLFSKEWMVKGASRSIAKQTVDEEWDYIENNPHEAQLRDIFATAKIDYGRIDYTVHDGHIRVFEINTNPQIVTPGASRDASRTRVKRRFAERFVKALQSCDSAANQKASVPVNIRPVSVRTRRISLVERALALTNAIGLARYEPMIFRRLFAIRTFLRTNKGKLWAHTPTTVRRAIRPSRHSA